MPRSPRIPVRRRPLFILPSGQGRSSLPGRRRSTALVTPVTTDGHFEKAERLTSRPTQRSNIISQTAQSHVIHRRFRAGVPKQARRDRRHRHLGPLVSYTNRAVSSSNVLMSQRGGNVHLGGAVRTGKHERLSEKQRCEMPVRVSSLSGSYEFDV
jgi:ribosomal protein L27